MKRRGQRSRNLKWKKDIAGKGRGSEKLRVGSGIHKRTGTGRNREQNCPCAWWRHKLKIHHQASLSNCKCLKFIMNEFPKHQKMKIIPAWKHYEVDKGSRIICVNVAWWWIFELVTSSRIRPFVIFCNKEITKKWQPLWKRCERVVKKYGKK